MNGCPHSEESVTYQGSNRSHWRRRCKICGLIEGGRRDRSDRGDGDGGLVTAGTAAAAAANMANCLHQRFHWRGSNKFQYRKLCLDCGKVWTIKRPLEVPPEYKTGKTATKMTKTGTK